jgi:hypothetical protein
MTKKRIHLVYGILLSAMLVIAGICLCVACVGIYLSGDQPFSREAVAAAFRYIAVPVYLCLALVIGGFFLDGFFSLEKKKNIDKQYFMILAALQKKLDPAACDPKVQSSILVERKARKLRKAIGFCLLAVGSVVFLSYGMNPANFHQSQINSSMVKAMWLLLPCLGIPFCYGVFSAYADRKSMQNEISLIKKALADGAGTSAVTEKAHSRALLYLRLALLCVGIGILVYGFFAGGTADVMTKAVNICTECVGLG